MTLLPSRTIVTLWCFLPTVGIGVAPWFAIFIPRGFEKLWERWKAQGAIGVAALLAGRVSPWYRTLRGWYRQCLGWLVELGGNRVWLDGCRFDVSHPQISRRLRARFLRGAYEPAERDLLKRRLNRDIPVIELGGGLGVVATLVNRLLHNPAHHVVVEANPALIPVIERQKALNDAQFAIIHAAVGYSPHGLMRLHVGDEFIAARVESEARESIEVPAMTLQQILQRHPYEGATLVCDIEGMETELVAAEGEVLSRHFDTLIIEVHPGFRSPDECAALFVRLDELGFHKIESIDRVAAFRHRRTLRRDP